MAKKKIAAEAYQARKNEARAKIEAWLKTEPKIESDVKQAILYFTGTGQRMTGTRTAGVNLLKEALLAGPLTPMEIFQKFELGTPEMKNKIRDMIKVEPSERVWVELKDGKYQVVGKGEREPRGWTGYKPAKSEEL